LLKRVSFRLTESDEQFLLSIPVQLMLKGSTKIEWNKKFRKIKPGIKTVVVVCFRVEVLVFWEELVVLVSL
jgi:hypothetical protein